MKGAAATGVAATGIGAFGGQAAAQQDVFDIGDVTVVDSSGGLVVLDVTLTNVNVDVIDDINIRVRDVLRTVTIEDVIADNTVTVTLEDINVQALNNLNVVVQALSSGGAVIETERQLVQNV